LPPAQPFPYPTLFRSSLGHIADGAPDVGRIDLVEIDAVDQDGARSGRIELQDEFFQGGLARADAADDADLFAGLDAEADVVQRRDRAVRVGEGDALELDAALQDGPRHERAVGRALDRHAHVIVDGLQGRLALWYCIIRPTTWPSGARQRPEIM